MEDSMKHTFFYILLLLFISSCNKTNSSQESENTESQTNEHSHNFEGEEESHYEVSTVVEGGMDDARLVLIFDALGGFHINEEYPWQLEFVESSPVEGGPIFGIEDAQVSESQIRFEARITECEIGAIIDANLSFALCSPGACEQASELVTWEICNADFEQNM